MVHSDARPVIGYCTNLVINLPLFPPSNNLCQTFGTSSNFASITVSPSEMSILPSLIQAVKSSVAFGNTSALSEKMKPDSVVRHYAPKREGGRGREGPTLKSEAVENDFSPVDQLQRVRGVVRRDTPAHSYHAVPLHQG